MSERCGAKTRAGTPCKLYPVKGRARCKLHGGATLRAGPDHPRFKHGRYSKSLPVRLAADYERMRRDPEALALEDDIAVVRARLVELQTQLDSQTSAELWQAVRAAWDSINQAGREQQVAISRGDADGEAAAARRFAMAQDRLGQLIEQGAADSSRWREYMRTSDHLRKMVDGERRRRKDMYQAATLDEVMTLVAAIAASVRKHIDDRAVWSAIDSDISAAIGA